MDESQTQKARPARRTERASDGQAPRGGGPAQMGNALEVLRVATTLIVVLYHAALTYVATPLRLTLWASYDASGHVAFDYFIYWVNGFAMPVFFLAAGVSAPAACESRGARVFLSSRVSRLLRPLLFGSVTIVPAFYLIWGYGLMVTGRCSLDNILNWRYEPEANHNLYGFGHLWFLEYLFVVCVVWCAGWAIHKRWFRGTNPSGTEGGWVDRVLRSPWRPLLCAIPTALIFLLDSDTMLRVDNVIVPNVSRVVHYTLFFALGALIARVGDPKERFIPYGKVYLCLSVVVFALMSPLLLQHAASPLQGWSRVGFCVLAALFPWLTVFGGLGVLLGTIQGRGAGMRFLTEASFWIYLIHVPVVALMQILLLPLHWPGAVKFLLVSAVALVVSAASYEWIVRRSLIGEIINGARKRSPKGARLSPEFGWIASAVVIVVFLAGEAWYHRTFFLGNNFYEEIPGQFYRSARLKPKGLDEAIGRDGLKTVITFTGGGDQHPWILAQKRVCEARHVAFFTVPLRADQPPARRTLARLTDLIEQSPRPILVQGYRGIDQGGLASAIALMARGESPHEARREFDAKYGQVGGPAYSLLGRILLDYEAYLNARHLPHSVAQLKSWIRDEYQARPLPSDNPPAPGSMIARGARRPVLIR